MNSTSVMVMVVMMLFLTVKIYSRLPPNGRAKTVNYRMVEKKILDRILSPSIYDSQIRPKELCCIKLLLWIKFENFLKVLSKFRIKASWP